MELTNKLNLPEPIENAIVASDKSYKDSYTQSADISVTQLLQPPQIVRLNRVHADELVEDVSDRIWALLGQSVHQILENGASDNDLVEERFYATYMNNWVLAGQVDRYDLATGILQDWKLCSVWEHIGGLRPEREEQLNCLAHLLRVNGHDVQHVEIVSLYRDWSMGQAKRGGNYPQQQVEVHRLPLWSEADQEFFINERIRMHRAALGGNVLPCTPEDQWARDQKWAVMQKGKKRALKLHDNLIDANQHAHRLDNCTVEERPGERVRCENYCGVRDFCPQYKAEHEDG